MYKVLVFAGTTEGYEICRFLADHKIETKGFVATEYGSKSLTENEFLTVQTGRLDAADMEEVFLQEKPEMVLDATHPYAAEVTVNIRTACENTQTAYYRVLREAGEHEDRAVYVDSVQAAADYLDQTQGNVLLTTGSKELAGFTGMKDYQNRLYARVLSLPNVMKACAELGFEGKHLIGMQGPFSRELNAAMLRQYDCRYLVTKDTGKAGGFQDKIDAALECDAVPVIIGRPLKEEGMSVRECKRFLTEHFGLAHRPHITLLGIGMGSQKLLTVQGKNSLDQADLLIGARRMVDSVKRPGQDVFVEYRSQEIRDYIDAHPEYDNIVIVLSGDVGFYSGARKLLEVLCQDSADLRVQRKNGSEKCEEERDSSAQNNTEIEIQCGISSVVYFMSQIGLSWDDAKIVSAHGRGCNLISHICYAEKVFSILGTSDGVAVLAEKLVKYGMGDVLLYVGENLSYENETSTIWRRDLKPTITLRADVTGGAKADSVSMALYDTDLKAFRAGLPEGVTFEKDGSLEWSEKSMTYIVGAMPMMVFFVLMVLMFELGNIPKLIMAVVTGPLGLIGAILTLLVTRQAIGFVAIIGFVALSGMVIRNSIILLDQIRQHLESGKTPYDAVVESAALRFRPIMLSSVTDVLGFVPLIPNPFWRPLAVSFIGGLLLATAIGLLVVPAMYCWWYKVKEPCEQ